MDSGVKVMFQLGRYGQRLSHRLQLTFGLNLQVQLPEEPAQLPCHRDDDLVPMQLPRREAAEPITEPVLCSPRDASDLPALSGLPGR